MIVDQDEATVSRLSRKVETSAVELEIDTPISFKSSWCADLASVLTLTCALAVPPRRHDSRAIS